MMSKSRAETCIKGIEDALKRANYCTVKVNSGWLEQIAAFVREQEATKQELLKAGEMFAGTKGDTYCDCGKCFYCEAKAIIAKATKGAKIMSETTHDYWWALRAYNTQAQYGYGTRNQAQQWADHLNRGREANLYAPEMCDSQQSDRLDAGDEGVDLADELAAIAKAKK